ncbi:hypothetical protein AAG570_003230 [Ranatra chinensis]|uniref:Uncharacterized protein n=1 Tax=Ranatra chinensis TaxID=642074 RepID=A0ABD0Y693_9HEMI
MALKHVLREQEVGENQNNIWLVIKDQVMYAFKKGEISEEVLRGRTRYSPMTDAIFRRATDGGPSISAALNDGSIFSGINEKVDLQRKWAQSGHLAPIHCLSGGVWSHRLTPLSQGRSLVTSLQSTALAVVSGHIAPLYCLKGAVWAQSGHLAPIHCLSGVVWSHRLTPLSQGRSLVTSLQSTALAVVSGHIASLHCLKGAVWAQSGHLAPIHCLSGGVWSHRPTPLSQGRSLVTSLQSTALAVVSGHIAPLYGLKGAVWAQSGHLAPIHCLSGGVWSHRPTLLSQGRSLVTSLQSTALAVVSGHIAPLHCLKGAVWAQSGHLAPIHCLSGGVWSHRLTPLSQGRSLVTSLQSTALAVLSGHIASLHCLKGAVWAQSGHLAPIHCLSGGVWSHRLTPLSQGRSLVTSLQSTALAVLSGHIASLHCLKGAVWAQSGHLAPIHCLSGGVWSHRLTPLSQGRSLVTSLQSTALAVVSGHIASLHCLKGAVWAQSGHLAPIHCLSGGVWSHRLTPLSQGRSLVTSLQSTALAVLSGHIASLHCLKGAVWAQSGHLAPIHCLSGGVWSHRLTPLSQGRSLVTSLQSTALAVLSGHIASLHCLKGAVWAQSGHLAPIHCLSGGVWSHRLTPLSQGRSLVTSLQSTALAVVSGHIAPLYCHSVGVWSPRSLALSGHVPPLHCLIGGVGPPRLRFFSGPAAGYMNYGFIYPMLLIYIPSFSPNKSFPPPNCFQDSPRLLGVVLCVSDGPPGQTVIRIRLLSDASITEAGGTLTKWLFRMPPATFYGFRASPC